MKKGLCLLLIGALCVCLLPAFGFAEEPAESTLPEYFFEACPEQGTITSHWYKYREQLKVWTPCDYNENQLYEIVLLLHGDGGSLDSWLTQKLVVLDRTIEGRNIFDWMAYEKTTVPFIVVTLNNKPFEFNTMVHDVMDALVFVSARYSTYADGTLASVIRNRDHITIGGLSRGSILTTWVLRNQPEIAGNYICMSGAGPSADALETLTGRNVRIRKLYTAVGVDDPYFYTHTKRLYELIADCCDESMYVEYACGHTWDVWIPGVLEGLQFILPAYDADYQMRMILLHGQKNRAVPLPCLFRMRNRR